MNTRQHVRGEKPVSPEIATEIGSLLTRAKNIAHDNKLDIAFDIEGVIEVLKSQRSNTATFDGGR